MFSLRDALRRRLSSRVVRLSMIWDPPKGSRDAYMLIGDRKFKKNVTCTISRNTKITIFLSSFYGGGRNIIYLNGEQVVYGSFDKEYTFEASENVNIEFVVWDDGTRHLVYIDMPAP